MAEKKPAGLAPDAVKNLIADLEQAQKEYDKDPRRGTRLALLAVFFFVQRLEDRENILVGMPLADLLCALVDVDSGISNKLLDRLPRTKGADRMGVTTAATLTSAAAQVSLMVKGFGVPPGAAIDKVARDLGLDKAKLREFLKNIRRGRAPKQAQQFYWAILQGVLPRLKERLDR
jgi:hypothetical protein